MANIFTQLIDSGRVGTAAELKSAYRRIIQKLHPDTSAFSNSEDLFIEYTRQYNEALNSFAENPEAGSAGVNYQELFYTEYLRLEMVDKPFAFKQSNPETIDDIKNRALNYFAGWRNNLLPLYITANEEYDLIKAEKINSASESDKLIFGLTVVFNNILKYRITGLKLYRIQLKQSFDELIAKLKQQNYSSLAEFLIFLADEESY